MTLSFHYQLFGHYNAWANQRLYDAAARLSAEQYRADRGAFFKSVRGTFKSSAGDRPDLDAALHRRGRRAGQAGCDPVRHARGTSSRARGRGPAHRRFRRPFGRCAHCRHDRYRRVSTPEVFGRPLAPALAHWFNHQTHHRGQVHALLSGLAGQAPELDLLIYQRLSAKSAA